jgi:hypothetical protein
VASKRSIQELIRFRMKKEIGRTDSDIELLSGWRGAAVGKLLDEVLSGNRSIHVRLRTDDAQVCLDPSPAAMASRRKAGSTVEGGEKSTRPATKRRTTQSE